jgi:hypothetical protein
MRNTFLFLSTAICLTLLAIVVSPKAVEAGSLKATIHLTQHEISKSANTEQKLMRWLQSGVALAATRPAAETTEPEMDQRKFLINMVVAFNAPINDYEFTAHVYDIEDGPRGSDKLFPVMTPNKGDKVIVTKLKLPRPEFKPQRRYEVVIVVRKAEVGSKKFMTGGEKKKNTGLVEF